ncbi:hypothetical protein SLEP1_g9273 [Rubroshorea leprosula]|uniref:Cytochrome P450 n=1 Tax=Rubroshorea leprosula TaxID=152421 RepID=A0AAV5IDP8_9ROSI|nr:hypothetical protein SLEP1_g9273 [Rubroshorea leprosula]
MAPMQELATSSISPLFLSLLLSLSMVLLFLKLIIGRRSKLNFPPSPPKLPLIGNLHQFTSLPHRSFQALSKKYGHLMLLQLGKYPTLVVSSADMVREITRNHDIAFSNRPRTTAAETLLYGCQNLVFSPFGKYLRKIKKICTVELLSHKKEQSFMFIREEEVGLMIDKAHSASLKGDSINLSEMLMIVANNVISRCVMSQKVEEENGRSRFGELFRRVMIFVFATYSIGDIYPHLWWLDVVTGYIKSLKAFSGDMDGFLDQVIQERGIGLNMKNHGKEDFLDILLQLQKNGMLEVELTQNSIKAIILDMFVGGTDTTAVTTEWAMTELIRNPKVMEKVQAEVRSVVGKKSKVDGDDIKQMDYLKCVIKETLRLYPPGPLLVPRETAASVKLGGYDIPSNCRVFINAWAIQRDPELWDRPDEFIPERFMDNSIDYRRHDFQYIPFGFGRRVCPGLSFAVMSAEYLIANLLYWFDWKLPYGTVADNLDMDEVYGLTLSKKVPLHLIPINVT